jgi:lipopolysaccharide/colanic/teichoic acid biosynthesis glycosyltransferase
MIRFFDVLFSFLGLIILLPVFFIISLLNICSTKGMIFFKQKRVGKNNKDFTLIKFRTMRINAEKRGLLTVGEKDARITKMGFFLRKFKLDELPQLWNVLTGDMSLVGPRPEVRKYVDLYNKEQKRVLEVRPGITDYASIAFVDENKILAQSNTPEKQYIEVIIPQKLQLNLRYIENCSLKEYFKILFFTVKSILKLNREFQINQPSG